MKMISYKKPLKLLCAVCHVCLTKKMTTVV